MCKRLCLFHTTWTCNKRIFTWRNFNLCNYKQWLHTFLSVEQTILCLLQTFFLDPLTKVFNFRLQGFVLMWKKNGNIISVGNQILGNVSLTENDWTNFCNLTQIKHNVHNSWKHFMLHYIWSHWITFSIHFTVWFLLHIYWFVISGQFKIQFGGKGEWKQFGDKPSWALRWR